MVREASARGISTTTSTNFSIPFDAARAEAVVASGLDVLGVSLDGRARRRTSSIACAAIYRPSCATAGWSPMPRSGWGLRSRSWCGSFTSSRTTSTTSKPPRRWPPSSAWTSRSPRAGSSAPSGSPAPTSGSFSATPSPSRACSCGTTRWSTTTAASPRAAGRSIARTTWGRCRSAPATPATPPFGRSGTARASARRGGSTAAAPAPRRRCAGASVTTARARFCGSSGGTTSRPDSPPGPFAPGPPSTTVSTTSGSGGRPGPSRAPPGAPLYPQRRATSRGRLTRPEVGRLHAPGGRGPGPHSR